MMEGYREAKSAEQLPDDYEFLTPEESKALVRSLLQPTAGTCLEMFIWEFEYGDMMRFAAKVGYHPNSITTLKSAARPISAWLFRRMMGMYKRSKKEREFWGKWLLRI